MDKIARLSASDRSGLFITASSIRGDMLPTLVEKDLEEDYDRMREMFFSAPPALDDILAVLTEIERQVNGKRLLPER